MKFLQILIKKNIKTKDVNRIFYISLSLFITAIGVATVLQNIFADATAANSWASLILPVAVYLAAGAGMAATFHLCFAQLHGRFKADRAAIEDRLGKKSRELDAEIEKHRDGLITLNESEKRFRAIVEGSSHGIIVHRDGCPLFANPAMAEMLGYDHAGDVLQLPSISDFVFEDDVVLVRNLWTRRMAGEDMPDVVGYRCQRVDGRVISVEVRATQIDWDGEPAVLAACYDTTEQKSGEYAVRENAVRLRRLVETIPYGVQENDIEGTITFSNAAHAAMMGYEHGELVGKKIWDFEIDEDRRNWLKDYFAVLVDQQPPPEPFFSESYTKDGRRIDVRVDWTYIRSQTDHLLGFSSIITEVTESKRAKEALEDSEKRLKHAVTQAGLGYWRWSARDRKLVNCSEELNAVAGSWMNFGGRTAEEIYRNIHPDDLQRVLAVNRAANRDHTGFDIDYRVVLGGGEHRHIREVSEPEFSADGKYLGSFGTMQDITEAKRVEDDLRIQAQIIDQIHESVISTDLDGTVTSWNKGAEGLFGCSAEEAIGRPVKFIYPEEEHDFLVRDVIEPLMANGSHDAEVRMRRKSGEDFYAHLALSLLREGDGTPFGMIGYSIDITKRKRAEQALARSEEHFRTLAEATSQGITVIQGDRLVFANPAAADMLGYDSPDDFLSLGSIDQIVHRDDRDLIRDRRQARLRGEEVPSEYEFRTVAKDGRTVWVKNRATTIEWDDQPAVFSIYQDISELKSVERKTELADQSS